MSMVSDYELWTTSSRPTAKSTKSTKSIKSIKNITAPSPINTTTTTSRRHRKKTRTPKIPKPSSFVTIATDLPSDSPSKSPFPLISSSSKSSSYTLDEASSLATTFPTDEFGLSIPAAPSTMGAVIGGTVISSVVVFSLIIFVMLRRRRQHPDIRHFSARSYPDGGRDSRYREHENWDPSSQRHLSSTPSSLPNAASEGWASQQHHHQPQQHFETSQNHYQPALSAEQTGFNPSDQSSFAPPPPTQQYQQYQRYEPQLSAPNLAQDMNYAGNQQYDDIQNQSSSLPQEEQWSTSVPMPMPGRSFSSHQRPPIPTAFVPSSPHGPGTEKEEEEGSYGTAY